MDPFHKIPSPVLLTIVKLSPDLASLRNWIHASPVVSSLFDELAGEITEAVISSALPPQAQIAVRSVVLVDSYSFSSGKWPDIFHEYIAREALSSRIPRSTAASILRRTLELAFKIQQLSDLCIQDLIARCMALKPSHLLDPDFSYTRTHRTYPQGQRYQQQDIGPPSWVEEQRVQIALWRLQLLFALRRSATLPKWPAEKLENQILEIDRLYDFLPPDRRENIKCIYEILQGKSEQSPADSSSSEISRTLNQLPNLSVGKTKRPWQSANPQDNELGFLWGRQTRNLENTPGGYHYFQGAIRRHPRSPLRGCSFDFFRALGFSIWDNKRMVAFGFKCGGAGIDDRQIEDPQMKIPYLSKDNLQFTWQSIVPEEQAQNLE